MNRRLQVRCISPSRFAVVAIAGTLAPVARGTPQSASPAHAASAVATPAGNVAAGNAAAGNAAAGNTLGGNTRPAVPVAVQIAPDTVRIGQAFVVVVRLRVPQGATVVFPAGPDSGTAVEALDPRVVANTSDSAGTDITATYRLAAWDLGRQPIGFSPITVRGVSGDVAVPLTDLTILVAPTTPADAAHRLPKAARPMFTLPRPWWPPWAIAAAVLLGIVTLWLIAGWRRSRPRHATQPVDAFAEATREFGALDRVGLLDAGEAGRFVTLSVDVMRTYLVRRLAPASMAQTTVELMAVIGSDPRLPRTRLQALLAESDRVRFARHPTSGEGARALGTEARRIVEEVERRATAASAETTASTSPGSSRVTGPHGRGHAA